VSAAREKIAQGSIWMAGAVLGAISSVALLIAAALPALLGLAALFLEPIRALVRRIAQR
jgi:hypothetical protein